MIDKSSPEHLSSLSRNGIWPIRLGICNPQRTTHHQSTSCRFSISYRLKIICDLELRASRISPIELPCPCTRSFDQASGSRAIAYLSEHDEVAQPPFPLSPQNPKSQFIYPHFLLPAPWTRSPQASKAQPRLAAGKGRTHIVILDPRPR
jgi:hypothetical protein